MRLTEKLIILNKDKSLFSDVKTRIELYKKNLDEKLFFEITEDIMKDLIIYLQVFEDYSISLIEELNLVKEQLHSELVDLDHVLTFSTSIKKDNRILLNHNETYLFIKELMEIYLD